MTSNSGRPPTMRAALPPNQQYAPPPTVRTDQSHGKADAIRLKLEGTWYLKDHPAVRFQITEKKPRIRNKRGAYGYEVKKKQKKQSAYASMHKNEQVWIEIGNNRGKVHTGTIEWDDGRMWINSSWWSHMPSAQMIARTAIEAMPDQVKAVGTEVAKGAGLLLVGTAASQLLYNLGKSAWTANTAVKQGAAAKKL